MHAVHISSCVLFLVATMTAAPMSAAAMSSPTIVAPMSADPMRPAPRKGITINFTGPVRVIKEGCGSQFDVAGPEHTNVPTADQCTVEDGFCVIAGGRCNDTLKTLYNSYHDHCVCCVPEKQGCPDGLFMSNGSKQCFKFFNDEKRSWDEANTRCKEEGLVLAMPSDAVAIGLRKDLIDTYGDVYGVWVDARGDGSKLAWQRDGTGIRRTFWWPGWSSNPSDFVTTDKCLRLNVWEYAESNNPERPYGADACSNIEYSLCEVE